MFCESSLQIWCFYDLSRISNSLKIRRTPPLFYIAISRKYIFNFILWYLHNLDVQKNEIHQFYRLLFYESALQIGSFYDFFRISNSLNIRRTTHSSIWTPFLGNRFSTSNFVIWATLMSRRKKFIGFTGRCFVNLHFKSDDSTLFPGFQISWKSEETHHYSLSTRFLGNIFSN